MSEARMAYVARPLQPPRKECTLSKEADALRADLEELERRLIPLLVTVQRALGKEPMILTRAERRRG